MAALIIILSVFIGACVAINPVSLSGNVEDHVAREQLSNVMVLERPSGASLPFPASHHRSTRSASTHTVNSTTFSLTGDHHQYGLVFYSGAGSPVVFALMYQPVYDKDLCVHLSLSSTLWRSGDYGTSFQKASISNNRMSRVFFQNPTNPKELVFTDEQDDYLYITSDDGQTFSTVEVPIDPQTIKFHPSAPNVAMAFQPPGHSRCGDVHGTLYITVDGGHTWQQKKEGVKAYFWEDDAHELLLSERGYNELNVTLYYTLEGETKHRIYRTSVIPAFTGDVDVEFDPALGEIDNFALYGQFIFAETIQADGSHILHVSSQRRPFKKAKIPVPYQHQRYYIDVVRDSQALVIVEHSSDTSPSGKMYNVYLSDSEGASYSLALEDLAYFDTKPGLRFDLEYIEGLPGTYIANQYLSGYSGDGNNVRTLISFDGGAKWNFIAPPSEILSNGQLCEPPLCSLHFHMSASANYSRLGVASWASIPGIILAHGTAGSKLADEPDLYISRDGGVSWQLTLEKAWGVNLMDYGGVIMAAKDYTQQPSRVIQYTCQEGLPGQWQNFTFLDRNIIVWGVVTEPGETSVQSLLFGTAASLREWMVTKVDFSKIFLRTCDLNDYFSWEPWNARVDSSKNCLFGETLTVERRLVNVCCYSGGDYTRVTSVTPCVCIPDDYECDWGYKRESDSDGLCVSDPDIDLEQATCNGTHLVLTKGYRKIAGDHCIGGDTAELEPTVIECSSKGSTTATSGASSRTLEVVLALVFTVMFIVLAFMIVMLSVMVVFMFKRYRRMRQTYRSLLGANPHYQTSSPQTSGEEATLQLQFQSEDTPTENQYVTDDEPLIDP